MTAKTGNYGSTDVTIVEISPRDGFPYIRNVTTEQKINLINMLSETGIKKIDAIAFTHPALFPQNADAEEVVKGIKKKSGVTYACMIPGEMGCRRAVNTKIEEITFVISVSDAYNQKIGLKTLRETLNKIPTIFEMAINHGKTVRVYVLAAFGCPYSSKISADDVINLYLKLSHLGASEISLVDSTGLANPKQVKSLVKAIINLKLPSKLAVHFHNTRNTAIANCVAAYEAGVRIFDTSLNGLSWPLFGRIEDDLSFWNVPTEDLVNLLEEMGIRTGVSLDRLMECANFVEKIAGRPLPGHLSFARSLANNPKIYRGPDNYGDL
jgi:hydroxymethylglutaryl-CoA lyase